MQEPLGHYTSVIQTINGHSDGKGVDARTYVARGALLECKRAMEQLEYPPLGLVPYVSSRFSAYLAQSVAQAARAQRLGNEGKPVVSRKGRRPKLSPMAAREIQSETYSATAPKGGDGT